MGSAARFSTGGGGGFTPGNVNPTTLLSHEFKGLNQQLSMQGIPPSGRTMLLDHGKESAGVHMRNITLTVKDDTYHCIRVWCAERDISVSRLVQIFLEDLPRLKVRVAFPCRALPIRALSPPCSTNSKPRIWPHCGEGCATPLPGLGCEPVWPINLLHSQCLPKITTRNFTASQFLRTRTRIVIFNPGAQSLLRGARRRRAHRCRLLMRVIARAHQRPRFDMPESHLQCVRLQLRKFARSIKARHRKMIARRPQILADGENVAAHPGQIATYLQQFASLFPQPDHHAGFGHPRRVQLLCVLEQPQRAFVTRP